MIVAQYAFVGMERTSSKRTPFFLPEPLAKLVVSFTPVTLVVVVVVAVISPLPMDYVWMGVMKTFVVGPSLYPRFINSLSLATTKTKVDRG
jgi:hypothetical protein